MISDVTPNSASGTPARGAGAARTPAWLEWWFGLADRGTDARTEVLAGATTVAAGGRTG